MITPDLSMARPDGQIRYFLNEKYAKKFDKKLNQLLFQVSKSKTKALIFTKQISEFYDELQFNDNPIFYPTNSTQNIQTACYLNTTQIVLVDQANSIILAKRKHMNFIQVDIFYATNQFKKINQLDYLDDKSFSVCGYDTDSQYKIAKYIIEKDTSIQCKYEFFFRNKILHAYFVSMNCMFGIFTESNNDKSSAIKLFKYEINEIKLREVYSTTIDNVSLISNQFKITSDSSSENIIIGSANRIIILNHARNTKKEVYLRSETDASLLNHIDCIKSFIIIVYNYGNYYLLDHTLNTLIQNTLCNANQLLRLDKCFTSKNFSCVYTTWSDHTEWSLLKKHIFEIESLTSEASPAHVRIIDFIRKIRDSPKATAEQKSFSKTYFEDLSSREGELSESEVFFTVFRNYFLNLSVNLVVTEALIDKEIGLIGADLAFNGFLNEVPWCYVFEFEIEKIELFDGLSKDELKSKSLKAVQTLLKKIALILEKDVIVVEALGKILEVTFSESRAHFVVEKAMPSLEALVGNDLTGFGILNMILKKFKRVPIVEECHLSLKLLDAKFDKFYFDQAVNTGNPDKLDQAPKLVGGLVYNPPVNWKRLGLNLNYLPTDSQKWLNDWPTAFNSICKLNDQKTGISLFCSSTIDEICSNSPEVPLKGGSFVKIALMCKLDPTKLIVPDNCPRFYSTPVDTIRSFGVLLKYVHPC